MYAALAWLLVALGALVIPRDFWGADVVVAIVIILAATWYYAVLRGRLRRGEAGVAQLDGTARLVDQVMAMEPYRSAPRVF